MPRVTRTATQVNLPADGDSGQLLLVQRQDFRRVLEENTRFRSLFDRHAARRQPAGMRRVASIPTLVVAQLKAAGIWEDETKLRAWLSDPENRAFRTDDGSKIR
jgi:hypothetical protein